MTPDQGESRPGTGRRVSRREFLRKAAAGAGALLFGGCACERSPATKAPLPIPTFEPFSGGIGGPEVVTSTPEAIDVLFQKSRWGVPVRLSSSEPPQKGDPLEIGLPFELERLRGLAGKELSPRLEEMYLAIGAWAKEEAVAFRPEDVIMISGPGNSLGAWIVDSNGAVHLMLHDNQGNWYPGLLADSGSAQILESCVLVEAGEGKDRKIQILKAEIVGETLGPGDISGFVYPTVIYGDKADRILIGLEGSRVLAIRVPSRFPMPEDEKIRKDIISEVHPNGGFYFTEAMSGKVIAVLNSWGIEPQWSIGNPKHLFESIEQGPEIPAWVVQVSNTEAKFNQEQNVWEYYSTAQKEEGQYIVSIKQDEEGEYQFFDYTEEEIRPGLHPELFDQAAWTEIVTSGAVKCLPFNMEDVEYFKVLRTDSGFPCGLEITFKSYPAILYWPYNKKGQISPSVPQRFVIYLNDITNDLKRPIAFTAFEGSGPFGKDSKAREFTDEENLTGRGCLAGLGTALASVESGYVLFTGYEVDDKYNTMTMDTFAQDGHGRLMVPVKSAK